jgi:hypothetical protein
MEISISDCLRSRKILRPWLFAEETWYQIVRKGAYRPKTEHMLRYLIIFAITVCFALPAAAQDFGRQQQGQERLIQAARKRGRIPEKEYQKLMKEQATIRSTIQQAASDGIWTEREKNTVAGRLDRAEGRLRRYKANREVY